MRIAAMCEPTAAARYRVIDPMEALARRGHQVFWPDDRGDLSLDVASTCDVVVVYRRCDPPTRQVIAGLKAQGVAIVWDEDTDFLHMAKSRSNKRSTGGLTNPRIFAEMMKTARMAHMVTAPSATLARVFEGAGVADVRVVANHIKPDRPAPRAHNGVTVGWIAGLEHRSDAAGLRLTETLRRLQAKHPQLSVTTVGVELGLRERYGHAPVVPMDQLPLVMADFDIGIAPLLDTAFNRARSDIKVKEYAASRVPWLASPHGPYAELGERQGGRLVADDGWFDALDQLVEDADARRRLGTAGGAWASTQTTDVAAARHERLFAEAIERATGRPYDLSRSLGLAGGRQRMFARVPAKLIAPPRAGAR